MTDGINLVLSISIMLLLFGVGLSTPFSNVLAAARQYQLMARGLIANFVIVPCVFAIALQGVPLAPEVMIGLLVLAAVPVAPLAPPFVAMAQGDTAYAVSLMVLAAVLGLLLTPLILALSLPASEADLQIDTVKIFQILLTVQLIPLGLGMIINRARPAWAKQLVRVVPKLGRSGILVTLIFIAAGQTDQILDVGVLPYVVALVFILTCLVIGDLAMRRQASEMRRSLAISTTIRNGALALVIVNSNLPGSQAVTIVFVFGLLSLIVSFIYGKLIRNTL
ncbi:MAG: BASS family bile acid:Na+ symporter [Gammaproteobacteria bacterium]|jgi:BASS family bile acid:Na+ symporter